MAKNMDFPDVSKKKKYSEAVQGTQELNTQYIAVPGIQGEKGETGPKGEKGDQGIQGLKGDKGDRGHEGPQGQRGEPGKGGEGYDSVSGQYPGWAYYKNKNLNEIRLGPERGDDGWVSINFIKEVGAGSNEVADISTENDSICELNGPGAIGAIPPSFPQILIPYLSDRSVFHKLSPIFHGDFYSLLHSQSFERQFRVGAHLAAVCRKNHSIQVEPHGVSCLSAHPTI